MSKEDEYIKQIRNLKKEVKKQKERIETLEKQIDNDRESSAWDFHWDGRGSYEESRRCFYGDFS